MPTIEITTRIGCKNHCSYCPQYILVKAYAKTSGDATMSFDMFKRYINKIPLKVDIHFTGMCEPWLNEYCTEMLLYAHAKGHKISVSTTLVGMELSDVDLLAPITFKDFAVHLPSHEGYEKIIVDEHYLQLLKKILKSKIRIGLHIHGKAVHPALTSLSALIKRQTLSCRGGNTEISNRIPMSRRRGVVVCNRLHNNVLLPNGNVVLCCMDYGMRHILGNLISTDYDSLFFQKEFLKVQQGLRDESLDILCRYCDIA
jgi:sulfatase maturation enzyme AslB (radical SAM superfamily)